MFSVGMGANAAAQATAGKLQPSLKDEARAVINRYLYAKTPQATEMFARHLRQLDTGLVQAIVKELDFRLAHGKRDVWTPRLKAFRAAAQVELNRRLF